jgi:hypothetical protein
VFGPPENGERVAEPCRAGLGTGSGCLSRADHGETSTSHGLAMGQVGPGTGEAATRGASADGATEGPMDGSGDHNGVGDAPGHGDDGPKVADLGEGCAEAAADPIGGLGAAAASHTAEESDRWWRTEAMTHKV